MYHTVHAIAIATTKSGSIMRLVPPHYLNRHSPDGSRTGVNIRVFPAFLQDWREAQDPR
jgi:hypothetical protein